MAGRTATESRQLVQIGFPVFLFSWVPQNIQFLPSPGIANWAESGNLPRLVTDEVKKTSIIPWQGIAHLCVVYLVWSSTYLAIRVAVRPGGGFPPFSLAALRCLLGFPVLLVWARLRGLRIRPTWPELRLLAVSGVLLWTFGNAFVAVAEQRVSSALAAILIASTPIWVAVLESIVDRHFPSLLVLAALAVGFLGTGLVGYPALRDGVKADALAIGLLLLASLSWGGGSLLQRRRPLELDSMVSAAYQMLAGGLGVSVLSLFFGEPLPSPGLSAWLGFAFLLVFGSIIAFTSFLKALHLLPTRVVFTYGYVNPVLATFLGWLVLGESISREGLAGAALVLVGVAGTFRARPG
jgi:drug/metabolite transporter (DMT)-like permease